MGTMIHMQLARMALLLSVLLSGDALGPTAKAVITAGGLAADVLLTALWIRQQSKLSPARSNEDSNDPAKR